MKHIFSISMLIGIIIAFSGCGKDDPIASSSNITIEDYISQNNLSPQYTSTGLGYTIITAGNSRRIGEESTITANVIVKTTAGEIAVDTQGEVFLNMFNQVPALKEGIALIGEGGRITLYVPYEIGWGESGNGNIPAASDVIVELTLGDILMTVEEYISANNIIATDTTNSGVIIALEQPGDDQFPMLDNVVEVKYRGYLTNGDEFDTSGDETVSFSLSNVILGWQEGIPKFSKGAKGKLFIPYESAYGAAGNASIPPRTDLIFDIELIDFD